MNENIKVLYKDKYLLLAVKPVGLLSEGDGESIGTLLSNQLGYKYVQPAHRLDRVCGGVMLLSCDPQYAGNVSALVADGRYHKEYLAVTEGTPEAPSGSFEDILFFDRTKSKTFIVDRQRKGAKNALLDYSVMETVKTEKGERTLVKVTLHTGRTHQIRAQFSSRGLPLCGDGKYGGKDNSCTCALWSYRAEFIHPITNKNIDVRQLPPDSYPWNLFDMSVLKDKNNI